MFRPVIARSPGGFGTLRTLKAWLAVAAALSGALAAASCNFNAAVVVNLPRWKADDKSVVFVGARPQASCSGDPSKLTLAFLLRDDRGNGIEEGSRIRIGEATSVMTTAGSGPTLVSGDVTVTLGGAAGAPDGGAGDPDAGVGSYGAQVTALRYVTFTSGGRSDRRDPLAAALLLDNGDDVQTDDEEGARLDGATAFTDGFVCTQLGEDRCAFGETELEILELSDSVVTALAPFLRDPAAIRTKLDLLRDSARARGDGPVYDGLAKAAPEVRTEAESLGGAARGALILLTRDGRNESKSTLDAALAAVGETPVYIAAREETTELRRIACESGGLLRPVAAPAEYGDAFLEIRDALRGRFEVDVDVSGLGDLAPGDHELGGTLGVSVGGVKGTTTIHFTITTPGA
jgi:hypothetical protein